MKLWQLKSTRSVVMDPHVPVGFPQREPDAEVIRRYNEAVAANVRRRTEKKHVVSIFHKRQAE